MMLKSIFFEICNDKGMRLLLVQMLIQKMTEEPVPEILSLTFFRVELGIARIHLTFEQASLTFTTHNRHKLDSLRH